jgi:hypothetical protein
MSKFRPGNPQIFPGHTQPVWVYSNQITLKVAHTGSQLIGQKAADHGRIIESFL